MRTYGIYQNTRDSAWQCLLDYGIDSLPVDVLKIARAAGFHVIKNSNVNILSSNEHGRSYFDGNKWYIIYDDKDSTEVSRYTVAHELGHIFLNHELVHIKYSHTQQIKTTPASEKQANQFATRLLCPACVLWAYGLYTEEDIARCCRVDGKIALERAKRMKTLVKRNKFLTSPIEKRLYYEFFEKKKDN